MPAMTPITIPAIAPPLKPPPPPLDEDPTMMLPSVPTGVTNGCVVVAPCELVIVTSVLLVGRRGALAVLVMTVVTVYRLL